MTRWIALGALALLIACDGGEAHEYPPEAKADFDEMCGQEAFCPCAWDQLTRTMPADDWEQVQARFEETGLMDPRVVRISAECREKAL